MMALSVFVEKYDEEHHPIPAASGVDMIHYLIETHKRTQRDVANGTGLAVSTISEILAGKRKLGVKHIQALARFFHVNPAVFLDE
jgi:HTH-type transcriptional regulator/antitoxin HigA